MCACVSECVVSVCVRDREREVLPQEYSRNMHSFKAQFPQLPRPSCPPFHPRASRAGSKIFPKNFPHEAYQGMAIEGYEYDKEEWRECCMAACHLVNRFKM